MEDYVATDQRPLDRCLEDIAGCELYVGIFAHRFGYIPDHDNPDRSSITELEYRHARIRALREELGRERLASFVATADQLAQQVSVAVTKQLVARQATYQLRGGLPAVPARQAWTIPPPVRSFTGRDQQLAALHIQLTSQGAATLVPTAALYGMGGVGKIQLALAYGAPLNRWSVGAVTQQASTVEHVEDLLCLCRHRLTTSCGLPDDSSDCSQ